MMFDRPRNESVENLSLQNRQYFVTSKHQPVLTVEYKLVWFVSSNAARLTSIWFKLSYQTGIKN